MDVVDWPAEYGLGNSFRILCCSAGFNYFPSFLDHLRIFTDYLVPPSCPSCKFDELLGKMSSYCSSFTIRLLELFLFYYKFPCICFLSAPPDNCLCFCSDVLGFLIS